MKDKVLWLGDWRMGDCCSAEVDRAAIQAELRLLSKPPIKLIAELLGLWLA